MAQTIYADEFPELARHYDACDEGHTRGHYEHLVELYTMSLEDAEDDNEKQTIDRELDRFIELVEKSDTEHFALVA